MDWEAAACRNQEARRTRNGLQLLYRHNRVSTQSQRNRCRPASWWELGSGTRTDAVGAAVLALGDDLCDHLFCPHLMVGGFTGVGGTSTRVPDTIEGVLASIACVVWWLFEAV